MHTFVICLRRLQCHRVVWVWLWGPLKRGLGAGGAVLSPSQGLPGFPPPSPTQGHPEGGREPGGGSVGWAVWVQGAWPALHLPWRLDEAVPGACHQEPSRLVPPGSGHSPDVPPAVPWMQGAFPVGRLWGHTLWRRESTRAGAAAVWTVGRRPARPAGSPRRRRIWAKLSRVLGPEAPRSRLGPARLARPRVSRAGGGRARLLGTAEAERAAPEPQPFQALSVRGSVKAESRALPRAWGPSFLPTRQQWLPCVVYGPSLLPPLPCLAEGQGARPASLWAPVSSFGCRGAVSALGPSQAGCGGEGRRPPPRPAPGSGCGSATGVGGEHRRAWSPRDPTRGAFH